MVNGKFGKTWKVSKYDENDLGETMFGETMTPSVTNKTNNRLKFLYRKNRFLTPTLRRLICNAIIQLHFEYVCSAWYPNLTKKLKNRTQTSQNNFIRFCQQLDKIDIYLIKNLKLWTGYPWLKNTIKASTRLFLSKLMINALIIWMKFPRQLQKMIFKLEEVSRR